MDALNIVRIILLIIVTISFMPQCYRLLSRRDATGLSPTYLLINLLAATEQFLIALLNSIVEEPEMNYRRPLALPDWLNMSKFGVVCVGHLILFCGYLIFPPTGLRSKITALSIYLLFLIITIFPLFVVVSALWNPEPNQLRIGPGPWLQVFLYQLHSVFLINPILAALAILAYRSQTRELRSGLDTSALSVLGVQIQAGVFIVTAFAWPLDTFMSLPWGLDFIGWCIQFGWHVVASLAFGILQAMIWRATRRLNGTSVEVTGGRVDEVADEATGQTTDDLPDEATPLMSG